MSGSELLLAILIVGTFGTTALIWREVRGFRKEVKESREGLKKYIRGTADREFKQLEALISLLTTMNLRHPLSPTRGWVASPDLLLLLYRTVSEKQPQLIVECGSGTSTLVLAHAAAQYGGRVVSLDHEAAFAEATKAELARQGLSADVRLAPLTDVEGMTWYDPAAVSDLTGIDLLFVDGPPTDTGALARYPALPLLWERCAPTLTVLLDDTSRADEKEISARWCSEYGLSATPISLEKGAHRLERA